MLWQRFFPNLQASRIKINPPVGARIRANLAIVTIVRNEEANIGHWLEFHKLAGVRDFILYDDCSTDQTVQVAMSIAGVRVTIIPWGINGSIVKSRYQIHRQVLAYAHAVGTFGAGYRWMTFIDIDEYLFPTSAETLCDTLEPLAKWSNVSIPWTMFGSSGHQEPNGESPALRYTQRARRPHGVLLNFKCIVDPCDTEIVSVHKFWTRSMRAESVNSTGMRANYKRRGTPEFLAADAIRLNHYCTLSLMEFTKKIEKGAVSGMDYDKRERLLRARADAIDADSVRDTLALEFLQQRASRRSPAAERHDVGRT